MRISFRLMLGFFAGAALVALVGLGSHWTNSQVHGQLERLTHNSINDVVNATDMVLALDEAEQSFRAWKSARQSNPSAEQTAQPPPAEPALAADENQSPEALADAVLGALSKFQRSLDSARLSHASLMRPTEPSSKSDPSAMNRDRLRAALRELRTDFETYSAARRAALETALAAETGESPPAAATDPKPDSVNPFDRLVTRLRDRVIAEKQRAEGEFTGEVRGAERSLAAADARNVQWTLLALALALALAIWLNRSIGRPLERLRRAAVSLGGGSTRYTDRHPPQRRVWHPGPNLRSDGGGPRGKNRFESLSRQYPGLDERNGLRDQPQLGHPAGQLRRPDRARVHRAGSARLAASRPVRRLARRGQPAVPARASGTAFAGSGSGH